jgi:hypothetical protein
MTTKYITYGETAFTMATHIPEGWPTDGTWTVTIGDKDGNDLVDSGEVTKYAGDTLSAAAKAGAQDIVLTTGTALIDGNWIAIGSDAQGWQKREVAKYVAGTKTVTLRTRLDEQVASGSEVRGLDLSVVVDASGWDTSIGSVVVYWEVDAYPDYQEEYDVRSKRSGVAGLENEFRIAFGSLFPEMDSANFTNFEDRARERLNQEFEAKGREFGLVVDSDAIRELMLAEIALLVARSAGLNEQQWDRLERDRENQMAIIDDLPLWIDDNEDEVENDDETQPAMMRNFMRGLF